MFCYLVYIANYEMAGGGGGGPIGRGKDHFRLFGYWLAALRFFLNFVNINSEGVFNTPI